MTDSFWAGGSKAYVKGLRDEYEPLLEDLRKRFKSATDASQRAEFQAEIDRIEFELQTKISDSIDALF